MDKALERELIQKGRDFLKSRDTEELEGTGTGGLQDRPGAEKAPAAPGEGPHGRGL